jgi:hypothetical protein
VSILDEPRKKLLEMDLGAAGLGMRHVAPVKDKDVHGIKNTFGRGG